ncbi:glycoside hydrolase family 3 C-terminal domain-containing protein [Paenibacillus nanensis]|uniref:glycoside hydrolase family 3 C-terminal domain-containing protein n=1 Tax=Paenibacillus nanensis TaxID=393251 RepID=UPI0013C364F6|nr:glycoside hydrolase family 3 C-terminal domain-containing protein [Paenibacillus nanensis]
MRKIKTIQAGKKAVSFMLTCTMSISLFAVSAPAAANAAEGDVIVFKTQSGGVFDGMPLFDGEPEHLDEFVDAYFDYTGLEGPAVYVTGSRNHYTLKEGPNAGRKIPGALSAADNVQGVSTDFPALVGMGQTWNKELLADIGSVMGSEKISQLKVKQGESNIHGGANASASVAFTVVSDMRINPLSGRFDEGFSEDPFMAGELIDSMAAGLGGTDQEKSEDGFWMRAAVGTKHFSVYNAQWYRFGTNSSAGPRAIFEYQTLSPIKALASGSVAGVMTSYGTTNGVPNIISPYQRYANEQSRFGVYSSPDFNGDQHTFNSSISNGYDASYAKDRTLATVLMALAKSNAGRPSPSEANGDADVAALVGAVRDGVYGITEDDLIEAARPHVNQLVRLGIFNETDENGIPQNYPFASEAKDVRAEPATYALPEHQEVALRAAQESIVLLKNDGTLPLAKDKKAAISGVYADSRFKTTYSVGTTPAIPDAGDSPLLSIIKQIGADHVSYDLGGKVIALKSKANGEFVAADTNANVEEGSQLITTNAPLDTNANAQLFRVIDLGQEGVSLLSLANNRFVTSPTGDASNPENLKVKNTDNTPLNLTHNDWDLAQMNGSTSTIPSRLRIERNDDDTVSIVTNGYRTGFSGEFADWYYANGRIVTTADHKLTVPSAPIGSAAANANRTDEVKFEETVVKEVGAEAAARAKVDDYAIVFVGAIPRHSAGEGNDRSSLYMGEDDYELVDKVSAAFAAEGKKTIVVVKSSFPVVMEEIQNNPNVSAIVYQPYGGQYDSKALAQVLYGDYAPTGRLASTWYADMSAFPAISDYSIPKSFPAHQLGVNIDPRYTVDMTNADPVESKLTYMYASAPVTYEFGYGLSYSSFEYSNLQAPSAVSGSEPLTVTVQVRNDGSVDTSEVVQLYVRNPNTAYGSYAPSKKLAAFEKVELAAGETKTVSLSVDPGDFAVWDVNQGDFIVEGGNYSLMVGASSDDIRLTGNMYVSGSALGKLTLAEPFNVFDHSYASNDVVYHEVSKERTAVNLKNKRIVGGYYAVASTRNGSWTALPKVDLTGAKKVTASVASDANGGVITLHADSPSSAPIAVIDVPATTSRSYTIENAGVPVTELGYTNVSADLSNTSLTGTHDLYIVFKAADLRIDSLSIETAPAGGGSGPIVIPQPTEEPKPTAPAAASAEVKPAVQADQEKAGALKLPGITVASDVVSIEIPGEAGYALAEVKVKGAKQGEITTFARMNADGTLTPVPSIVKTDDNGETILLALVSSEGLYVPLSVSRSFKDVPSEAWYAGVVADATSKLLLNGTGDGNMRPLARTTTAHSLMVALNVLGVTPEKEADDAAWHDAVMRTAEDIGLRTDDVAPESVMSREGMALILKDALAYAGVETDLADAEADGLLEGFADAHQLSGEGRIAFAAMVKHGIFKGKDDGQLHPASWLTRAELAAVALRAREAIDKTFFS